MEYRFYEVGRGSTARVLRVMLEKTLARGERAVVRLQSDFRVNELDCYLWNEPADGFLPHARYGVSSSEFMDEQPIVLTTSDELVNGARVLFHWQEGGVSLVDFPLAEESSDFSMCCFLYELGDEDASVLARTLLAKLANALDNSSVGFWRQGVDGWVKDIESITP